MSAEVESGTIANTAVKANRDGGDPVRMLDVEISGPEDVQSVQLVSIGGEDFHPLPGAKVMIAQVGNAWKMAIVLEDGLTPTAAAGEKFLYSQDSGGAIAALIKLLNTGVMELNGSADFAVRYNKMETAFNQLKSDFNSLITFINGLPGVGHVHTCGGAGNPTTAMAGTGSSSAADMTGAKVDTVKLP